MSSDMIKDDEDSSGSEIASYFLLSVAATSFPSSRIFFARLHLIMSDISLCIVAIACEIVLSVFR